MANQYQLPCIGVDKHRECLDILTQLCPNGFQVFNLVGSKCKTESGGCCVWSALYSRINNASIPVNDAINAANQIASVVPCCAKLTKKGNAWCGNIHCVIIRWKKTNCSCGSVFEKASTWLYKIELQLERKPITISRGSQIVSMEIAQWNFGPDQFKFTCVDFEEHAYLKDINCADVVTLTMAFENIMENEICQTLWSFIVGEKFFFVSVNTSDDLDRIEKEINRFIQTMAYPGNPDLFSICIQACEKEEDSFDLDLNVDNHSYFESNRPLYISQISKEATVPSIDFIVKTYSELKELERSELSVISSTSINKLNKLWNLLISFFQK